MYPGRIQSTGQSFILSNKKQNSPNCMPPTIALLSQDLIDIMPFMARYLKLEFIHLEETDSYFAYLLI
jgi:hypothetical protein